MLLSLFFNFNLFFEICCQTDEWVVPLSSKTVEVYVASMSQYDTGQLECASWHNDQMQLNGHF